MYRSLQRASNSNLCLVNGRGLWWKWKECVWFYPSSRDFVFCFRHMIDGLVAIFEINTRITHYIRTYSGMDWRNSSSLVQITAFANLVPSHWLKQCWFIIHWTKRAKLSCKHKCRLLNAGQSSSSSKFWCHILTLENRNVIPYIKWWTK